MSKSGAQKTTIIVAFFSLISALGVALFSNWDKIFPKTVFPICMTVVDAPDPPLNVRDSPNGKIIGTLPNGTKLTILKNGSEWDTISYKGTQGYIFDGVTKELCN